MLNRDEIEKLLPHGAAMVMLDMVRSCADASIVCPTRNHHNPNHPLRVDGRLSVLVGIEFAAQAMALHEALTRGRGAATARSGRLVALRGVEVLAETLDERSGCAAKDPSCCYEKVAIERTWPVGSGGGRNDRAVGERWPIHDDGS